MNEHVDELVVKVETLLRRVAFIIKKRGREILSDFSMTTPQFHALLVVRDVPGITMGELCERLFLACSTATDLVDRLERNGILERKRDFQDRRVVRLAITSQGLDVIDSVIKARRRYVSSIFEKLTLEEKQQLANSLERLHSLMLDKAV